MPPLKMDSRMGQLRYVDRRGKIVVLSGRLGFLHERRFADALLTGWGHDFEIRVKGGMWHPLTETPEEVANKLFHDPLSRRRLLRLAERPDYVLKGK